MSAPDAQRIPLSEGRRIFGSDPAAYATARPDYPDGLYEVLTNKCGLGPRVSVLEIGPGTGVATGRMLQLGASPIRVVEPDPNLAAFLRRSFPTESLQIDQSGFEDAVLPADTFDIVAAATSFHWLEQSSALTKVYGVLKHGGWWAMWWTHFGSGGERDPFLIATGHLLVEAPGSPGIGRSGCPFALDRDSRVGDLRSAGFRDVNVDMWRWSLTYETARLIDLYNTFSPVRALQPEQRERLLRNLALIAERQFGGRVERPFVTVLYTGQRP